MPPQTPNPSAPPPSPWVTPDQVLTLDQIVAKEAAAARISPDLLRRVIHQESRGNPKARSPKGAIGLGQVMPSTAKDLGGDPANPFDNVRMAATYLRQQLDAHGGDEVKALAAYNAGPGTVKKYGGVPPYRETRQFIEGVQGVPFQTPPPETWLTPSDYVIPATEGRKTPYPVAPTIVTPPPASPSSLPPVPAAPTPARPPAPAASGRAAAYGRFGRGVMDTVAGLATKPVTTVTRLGGQGLEALAAAERAAIEVLLPYISTPTALRETSRTVLPTVGGTVGGAIGARSGWQGAFGGSTLGSAVGEAASMGVETLTGAPPTLEEFLQRTKEAGMTGAAGELVGQTAIKLGRPFAKSFDPILMRQARQRFTEEIPIDLVGPRTETVTHVLPSEVSRSPTLNFLENVMEGSIAGGGTATNVREARHGLATKQALEAIRSISPTTGTKAAGQGALSARDQAVRAFRAEQSAIYNQFEGMAKDIPVESPTLDAIVSEQAGLTSGEVIPGSGVRLLRRLAAALPTEEDVAAAARPPVAKGPGGRGLVGMPGESPSQVYQRYLAELQGPPEAPEPPMTAPQFNKMVQGLGRKMRALQKEMQTNSDKAPEHYIYSQLYHAARQDLDTAVGAVSPEALAVLNAGRDVTIEGKTRLFNKTVMGLARTAPEQIVGTILKPNRSTAITAVQQAVGREGMAPVRAAALETLLRPAARTNKIHWGSVLDRIDRLGPDTVEALFPGGQAKDVQKLARLMVDLERKPFGRTGQVAIQLSQAGAGIALATNPLGLFGEGTERERWIGAAGVMLGPAVLARVMASPTGLKWLTVGMTSSAKSQTGIRAVTQLTAELLRDGLITDEEAQRLVPAPQPPPANPFGVGTPRSGGPTAPPNPFGVSPPPTRR